MVIALVVQGIRHLQIPGQAAALAGLSRIPHINHNEVAHPADRVIHHEVVLLVAGLVPHLQDLVHHEVQLPDHHQVVVLKVLHLQAGRKIR